MLYIQYIFFTFSLMLQHRLGKWCWATEAWSSFFFLHKGQIHTIDWQTITSHTQFLCNQWIMSILFFFLCFLAFTEHKTANITYTVSDVTACSHSCSGTLKEKCLIVSVGLCMSPFNVLPLTLEKGEFICTLVSCDRFVHGCNHTKINF